MKKMWEGRFSEASSELLEKFNASIEFDKNLNFIKKCYQRTHKICWLEYYYH